MTCTHSDNKWLLQKFSLRTSVHDVLEVLDTSGSDYMIFSNSQRITPDVLAIRDVQSLKPLSILVKSKENKGAAIRAVREDELLTLAFDDEGLLQRLSCKKIYTGP